MQAQPNGASLGDLLSKALFQTIDVDAIKYKPIRDISM
jgi:hypothetical protein